MSCQGFLGVDQRLGDRAQVMGDDAPAHPALHPIFAMVATAVQLVAPFQPTDAPFDPGPPVTTPLKPALALVGLAPRRLAARFGQHHAPHTPPHGRLFIGRAGHLAVANQQPRRTPESADVLLQTGDQLRRVIGIAREHRIATDDGALDLVQPHHAPELGWLAYFALADNRGMRLEDAHQLLSCRYLVAVDDPPPGLADDLLHTRNAGLQDLVQPLRTRISLSLENLLDLLGLRDHLLGQLEQLP